MRALLLLTVLLPCTASPGQDEAGPDPLAARSARLQAVLKNMAGAKELAFQTHWAAALEKLRGGRATVAIGLGRGAGARAGKALDRSRVRGVLAGELLYHSCLDGQHERLSLGRARAARAKGGSWELVTETLVDGSVSPFLFDPGLFFRLLKQQPIKLSKVAGATLDKMPVEVYSATLTGVAAYRLGLAGLYPKVRNLNVTLQDGRLVFRARGGVDVPKVGLVLDLAFYVDPGKGVLKRVVIHHYEFNPIFSILRARGLAPEDEGDEGEARTEPQLDLSKLEFVAGLPKRKLLDMPKDRFELRFSIPEQSKLPKLDARVRGLLGL